MKLALKYIVIFCSTLIIQGCTTRLDFCECMSLEKALTDQFLLSEKERKAKEDGCKWIHEELSVLEILQKWAECNGSQTPPESNRNQKQSQQAENANNESQSDQYNLYCPITPEGNYDKSELALYYYPNTNGNKPYAEFRFTDGTIFKLKPNCEGEYSWCIRSRDNVEIGFLKIEPDSEGEAIFLDIKFNENSSSYTYYLSKMAGTFRSF